MSELSSQFETLVLNELAKSWRYLAQRYGWLNSGITPPIFRIFDRQDRWGQWDADSREMSFSRSLVTKRPWGDVTETLKHEMAHQYVSEILHVTDEPPHGKTFFSVCKNYGIDAAVRGAPGANKVDATNHIVEKVRNLLALAKSDNENEAKVAAETAHRLMLKHNIDLQEKKEEKGYTVRFFGKVTGRIQMYMSELAHILSKYYFVEVIWIDTYDPRTQKNGHELEVSGTPDNLDVAEYVFEFLSRAVVDSWEAKFASPEFKDQMKRELAATYMYAGAPHTVRGYTISARSNFMLGFMQGFASQLKVVSAQETEAGLVLAKDIALEQFYRTRHPRIRHLAKGNGYNNAGWRHTGFNEGKDLKIPPAAKAAKNFTPLLGK